MLPYLLAVAGGYILGNAFKDDMPSFAEGGVVDPKMLYERLREAEMNWKNDDGAEYYRIQKEISENRELYFEKLRQAEMNWSKDDGAEYNRLMSMRDSFADGGMMAKGGLTDRDISMLKHGFKFTIFTDTERPNDYTITIEFIDNSVKYIVRKGGFDGRKIKSFDSEKEAFDYISEKVGRRVKYAVD